jgi:EAL domain-containing protein (putative c-di-GMP-specific phosphodiesterase class I)
MSERCLLDRILTPGSLSVRFQPVVELRAIEWRPHYFEALIRGPQGTSAENPSILFEYARKKNRESAVDRACVAAILEAAPGLRAEAMVGINVHASTLAMDTEFVDFLGEALQARGFSPRRLVVEIVEHAPPWDVLGFLRALDGLRALGARIALDDVGLGHSNFMMILQCRPDYFKVDRYFVSGCARDFHRRAVLSSVALLARPFGARVVAEGVEDPDDLSTLKRLGITLVQGYLFGAPIPATPATEDVGRVPPISVKGSAAPGYLSPAVAGGPSNRCA